MKLNWYWQFPHDLGSRKSIADSLKFIYQLDNHGFTGSLVYFHHTSLDPWITALAIINNSEKHVPLLAMQPYTMLPTTSASMIHSISLLNKRKVNLNLVTGFLSEELIEIGDQLDKSQRYDRIKEYSYIIRSLLTSHEPITFEGTYYKLNEFTNNFYVERELLPNIFMPYTSNTNEGFQALISSADTAVTIPKSFSDFKASFVNRFENVSTEMCVKLQIVARETHDDALNFLRERDGDFRKRSIRKRLDINHNLLDEQEIKLFFPMIDSSGPIIMGNYEEVVSYLRRYVDSGVRNFIVPNISNPIELIHFNQIMKMI
ncbi:LLM class flavin-dependent oxidoreductase [Paenibacillus kobensis]|uniref:LLM class flavin-dependent oxidoreductase n=1 Tax=Paenibacillus kobensis TaxID=59841 RepID=UPI000FDAF6BF|nr:LLM class flavin-dependent oxidoreductase [Paenibacillus kobensis]